MRLFLLSCFLILSIPHTLASDDAFEKATKGFSEEQKAMVRVQMDRISKMSPEEQSKLLNDTMKELNSPERQEKMKKEMESLSPEKRAQMESMLKNLKGQ